MNCYTINTLLYYLREPLFCEIFRTRWMDRRTIYDESIKGINFISINCFIAHLSEARKVANKENNSGCVVFNWLNDHLQL